MRIILQHKYTLFVFLCIWFQTTWGYHIVQDPNITHTFDSNFKDRYQGSKYNYEGRDIISNTPGGSGNYEAYENKDPHIKEQNNTDSFLVNLGPLSWLFYIAIVLAVMYLVYVLLNEGSSGLFNSNRNNILKNYDAITADTIENTDIDTLIKNAENEGDYRLAIRYYYLLILKTLSLKKHIKVEDDKTNADYLNDLSNTPFSNKFAYTSYLYDYIWYGEFPLNTEGYVQAKSHFSTLLNQIDL